MNPDDPLLSPKAMQALKDSIKDFFNPPNLSELKRLHDEVMSNPETQRLIQEAADEAFRREPCSETKQ